MRPTLPGGSWPRTRGVVPILSTLAVVCAFRGAELDAAPAMDWRMPPRFGLDTDGDGLIDVPNSPDYVRNGIGTCASGASEPRFCVTFDASRSTYAGRIDKYRWRVHGDGPGGAIAIMHESDSAEFTPEGGLPEGVYEVELTLVGDRGPQSTRATVPIEDFLIVSIGDSFASGQGNPERPTALGVAWADDGSGQSGSSVSLAHAAGRRSTISAHAQVALAIERADPRTSVTFIFLAETGATIAGDVLAQLREAARLAGSRRIDALLVSFGGNDIGFAQILMDLVEASPVLAALPDLGIPGIDLGYDYAEMLADIWWEAGREIQGLEALFTTLPGGIDGLGLDVLDVYITEYPEPGGSRLIGGRVERCERILAPSCELLERGELLCSGADSEICRNWDVIRRSCGVLERLFSPLMLEDVFRIDRLELDGASEFIVEPLNVEVRAAAARHHWTAVGAFTEEFLAGHGECMEYDTLYAGNPFPLPVAAPPAGARWFRSIEDSLDLQGEIIGAAHPNEFGHQVIARAILSRMILAVDLPALGVVDPDDSIEDAVAIGSLTGGPRRIDGEILQRSDVDIVSFTIPAAGEVAVAPASSEFPVAVRFFDERGVSLSPRRLGNRIVAEADRGGTFFLGISGPANTAYDASTGLRDESGGFVGSYAITVRWTPNAATFRRGDANGDGATDISDGVSALGFLFLGADPPACLDAADANDDGSIDIADPVATFGFLFLGDAAPPAPGPLDCGSDPTGDELSCGGYSNCGG